MATLYYIKNTATSVETELGAANGSGLLIERRTGAASFATWRCAAAFDTAPTWPYGTAVEILRKVDGTPASLFKGTVIRAEGDGTATSEHITYVVADAWYWLERLVYEQTRKIVNSGGTLIDALSSRVLLGQADDGTTRLTVAQLVTALSSYAATAGVSLTAGSIAAPVLPPWDELRDRTVAELILRALKWQPDAVAWTDPAAATPTLNVTPAGSMSALTLALTALDSCRLRSRPDLQVPGVRIKFELSNSHGQTLSVQEAGTPDALGAVLMTVPLEFRPGIDGPAMEIKVAALGDYTTVAWWQQMFPWLPNTAVIADATTSPVIPEGYSVLMAGTLEDWITAQHDVDAATYRVSCNASFTLNGHTYSEKPLSRAFTLTNATSRRYVGRFAVSYSEPEPAGLATAYYSAASVLQYEGEVTLTEAECTSGRAALGKILRVTGGLAAWASMTAVIQKVREDFDAGVTTLTVGPQSHLFPQDLVELLRASRLRSVLAPLDRTGAGNPEDDEDAVTPFSPDNQSSQAPGVLEKLTITLEE
jgi:hypothetical protein